MRGDALRLATNFPFLLGSFGIAAIALMALFGPQLAASDPQAQRLVIFYPDSSFAVPPTPPDQFNPLGTDPIGRDQLSRLLWGARLTVTVVLLGLAGRAALAVTLGVVAGWRRGGGLDHAIGYVTNAIGGMPQLMLALLIVIALHGTGIVGFVLALALVGWAELAQFVRAEVVRAAGSAHVLAARTIGGSGAHLVRAHVLRDLAPQLLGLLALEAGSILLLLAELGFIGFFIAGGVFYTDDSNRPILPVRDRAPEWGQMLAGARTYAFRDQYVAFVPGLVVVGAVLAFNLFAEGLRSASDPFGRHRLSPRTLGRIARGVLVTGLVASVAVAWVSVRSTVIGYDEGLVRAREAAARALPGSELIAGVVRFSSGAHAMARPDRLSYYFRDPASRFIRVTFLDADENALDIRQSDNEDGLAMDLLRPVADVPHVPWERALEAAEEAGGTALRNQFPDYAVRVVLAHDADSERPAYRVRYSRPVGSAQLEVQADALTGSIEIPSARLRASAASRARPLLGGGEPRLTAISATWLSPGPNRTRAFGEERPVTYGFAFVRGDISFPATVTVAMQAGREGAAQVFQSGSFGGNVDTRTLPVPPFEVADLERAFAKANDAGLRLRRETSAAAGARLWTTTAQSAFVDGRWVIDLILMTQTPTAQTATQQARFRYDPTTGEVRDALVPPAR